MKTLKGIFERCRSYLNNCKEKCKSYLNSCKEKYRFYLNSCKEKCSFYLNSCKEKSKSYLNSYNTKYGFLDSLFWIILSSLALFVVDYRNMISKLLKNYDFSLNTAVSVFVIMLIIFIGLKFESKRQIIRYILQHE